MKYLVTLALLLLLSGTCLLAQDDVPAGVVGGDNPPEVTGSQSDPPTESPQAEAASSSSTTYITKITNIIYNTGVGASKGKTTKRAAHKRKVRDPYLNGVRYLPDGHKAYYHVETGDQVSTSDLKAQGDKILGQANAHSDKGNAKTLADAKTYAENLLKGLRKPMNWDWLWPLLAIIALLALLYCVWRLIADSWEAIWSWLCFVFVRPAMINSLRGRFGKKRLPRSVIACRPSGRPLWEIQKAAKDLDGPSPKWLWAPVGGTLNFAFTEGGRVRFIVSVANMSRLALPTTGQMVISDMYVSDTYQLIKGSGRIYVGQKEIGILDDHFVQHLISGDEICLAEIIDYLPARTEKGAGRLNFVYDVEPIDENHFDGEVPGDDNRQREPMFRLGQVAFNRPEPPAFDPIFIAPVTPSEDVIPERAPETEVFDTQGDEDLPPTEVVETEEPEVDEAEDVDEGNDAPDAPEEGAEDDEPVAKTEPEVRTKGKGRNKREFPQID